MTTIIYKKDSKHKSHTLYADTRITANNVLVSDDFTKIFDHEYFIAGIAGEIDAIAVLEAFINIMNIEVAMDSEDEEDCDDDYAEICQSLGTSIDTMVYPSVSLGNLDSAMIHDCMARLYRFYPTLEKVECDLLICLKHSDKVFCVSLTGEDKKISVFPVTDSFYSIGSGSDIAMALNKLKMPIKKIYQTVASVDLCSAPTFKQMSANYE